MLAEAGGRGLGGGGGPQRRRGERSPRRRRRHPPAMGPHAGSEVRGDSKGGLSGVLFLETGEGKGTGLDKS